MKKMFFSETVESQKKGPLDIAERTKIQFAPQTGNRYYCVCPETKVK